MMTAIGMAQIVGARHRGHGMYHALDAVTNELAARAAPASASLPGSYR
jgi:hypothetical protein